MLSSTQEMERMDNQFQPLGICDRLLNFVDSIATRSLKCFTLGSPEDHGWVEIPVTGAPPNGADTMEGHTGNTTDPVEEVSVSLPAYEMSKKDANAAVEDEFEQANESENLAPPIATLGSSTVVLEEGSAIVDARATQLREGVVPSRSYRATDLPKDKGDTSQAPGTDAQFPGSELPLVQDIGVGKAGFYSSLEQVENDSQVTFEPAKTQNAGSAEVVPPSTSESQVKGPKKIVSFNDGAEGRSLAEDKEKKIANEKSAMAIEPEKGVEVKAPRPVRRTRRPVSNVNENRLRSSEKRRKL